MGYNRRRIDRRVRPNETEGSGTVWLLIVFVTYLVGVAAVGAYCARYNRTLADFVLGGRRLGPWVTALSAQASDMSAWLLIALPATAFADPPSAIWAAIGCAIGTVFNWAVVAPRLRRESERSGALTIPDYLAARYGGGRLPLVRVVSVLVILTAYATYIASQFMAAGKVFETTFGPHLGAGQWALATPWGELAYHHPYHTGMLAGVGIILLYTAMGGFTAVAWTDLVQGLLMVLTVLVLPLVGLALPVTLTGPVGAAFVAPGPAQGTAFVVGVCIAGLSWGLGYPGQPHILVRFMALRDPKKMRRAAVIGITWVILAMSGAIAVGLVGRRLVDGAALDTLTDADHVMPALAVRLMPPALAGLMIAGAVAAMMSTVDSQLLVAASAVEEDIYIRLLGGRPGDRRAVWIGRITVLVLGAIALPIAWGRAGVFKTVFNAWGVLAAGIGPVVILALLTRRTNRWGAFVGILAGAGIAQAWVWVGPILPKGSLWGNGLILGFFANLILAYVVSLLTGGSNRAETSADRPQDERP